MRRTYRLSLLLLAIAIILFALMPDRFLSGADIANVLRQSYLTIVALGQMVAAE